MAWIEVHQELREHKKLYACAELLKISRVEMLGTIVTLWLWALDNVPDGSLSGISRQTIARVCDWNVKKADVLVNALISTGWLDQNGDTLVIHDWTEYVGKLMERRRKDRERKKKSTAVPPTSAGTPQEFRGSSAEIPVLQYPNSTVPIPNHNYSAPNTGDITPPPQEGPAPFDGRSFTAFWDAYPKKHGREAAWEAWRKLAPSPETVRQIMSNLEAWKRSGQWTEDGDRYIPKAVNYLSDEGYWKHAPAPPKSAVPTGASGELGEAEREAIQRVLAQSFEEGDL